MSDHVLHRIANDRVGAMEECLDRYGGLVWSLAQRLCHNTADAEDAVQDAFLAIWKSADQFDPTKSAEKTFVALIARRRIIDRQRVNLRRPMAESLDDENALLDQTAGDTLVSESLEMQEEAQRARRLLHELRDDERRVLELAVDHGLSQTEIAARTKMPLGTVKTHARRGMLRLRELLNSPSAGEESIR